MAEAAGRRGQARRHRRRGRDREGRDRNRGLRDGIVEQLLVEPGAKVPVGTLLAIIRTRRRGAGTGTPRRRQPRGTLHRGSTLPRARRPAYLARGTQSECDAAGLDATRLQEPAPAAPSRRPMSTGRRRYETGPRRGSGRIASSTADAARHRRRDGALQARDSALLPRADRSTCRARWPGSSARMPPASCRAPASRRAADQGGGAGVARVPEMNGYWRTIAGCQRRHPIGVAISLRGAA